MENLFGLFGELPSPKDLQPPSTSLPPGFFAPRTSQGGRTRDITVAYPLTPLESQIKGIILNLYSDSGAAETVQSNRPQKESNIHVGNSRQLSELTNRAELTDFQFPEHGFRDSTLKTTGDNHSDTLRPAEAITTGTTLPVSTSAAAEKPLLSQTLQSEARVRKPNSPPATADKESPAMSGRRPKSGTHREATLLSSFSTPTFFSAKDETIIAQPDPQFPAEALHATGLPHLASTTSKSSPSTLALARSKFRSLGDPPGEHNKPLALRPSLQKSPLFSAASLSFGRNAGAVVDPDSSLSSLPIYSYSHTDSRTRSTGGAPHSVIDSFQVEPMPLQVTAPPHSSLPSPKSPPASANTPAAESSFRKPRFESSTSDDDDADNSSPPQLIATTTSTGQTSDLAQHSANIPPLSSSEEQSVSSLNVSEAPEEAEPKPRPESGTPEFTASSSSDEEFNPLQITSPQHPIPAGLPESPKTPTSTASEPQQIPKADPKQTDMAKTEPGHSSSTKSSSDATDGGSLPPPTPTFTTPSHKLPSAAEELQAPLRLEDIETSSTLSIHQLTESLQNEPPDLHSLADDLQLADKGTVPLPSYEQGRNEDDERTPTPTDWSAMTPSKYTQPLQPLTFTGLKDVPSPTATAKMPPHLQPSPKLPPRSPFFSGKAAIQSPRSLLPTQDSFSTERSLMDGRLGSGTNPGNQFPPNEGSSNHPDHRPEPNLKSLEEQLTKALQAKANLEGQLESVVDECKATLKDRAELQSKLARAETLLAEARERERSQQAGPGRAGRQGERTTADKELEHLRADVRRVESALEKEQRASSALRNEAAREKQQVQRMLNELAEARKSLAAQETKTRDLRGKLGTLQGEADKNAEEKQEAQLKLTSLRASYDALEKTKGWLHNQLQDAMESKMKLQEDLRDARATTIAQSIKMDQLTRENAAHRQQVGNLQKGVLQDKAKLVSELEAIEADVLSREDSYAHIVAEKAQLESLARMRTEDVERLTSDLAKARVEKEELERELEGVTGKKDTLSLQAESLVREKKALGDKLCSAEQEMEAKVSDLKELEKLKSALQERVRQSEAAVVSKEATMQGLNDAKDIVKHELEMVKQARDMAERQLNEAKQETAELEAELASALNENAEKDARIKAMTQAQQSSATERDILQSQLLEREGQLTQRLQEQKALEAQSRDVLDQFQALQGQFQSIAATSDTVQDSIAEKDRIIASMAAEKDRAEREATDSKRKCEQLRGKVDQLQQENARMEGQLEASSGANLEEFQRASQDKASLQAELNSLKVGHQHEMIKSQGKIAQLESELKTAKREAAKTEKQLHKALQARDEKLAELKEARLKTEARVQEVSAKLGQALHEKEALEGSLKSREGRVGSLQTRSEQLAKQNQDLVEQLQQELAQKGEIERASGMVALKLKQNAEDKEKQLQDQIRDLSLEVERLRGRLAGISTTQVAMRDHTGALEVALAERESSLVKLSGQAQKALQEKEMEDQAFASQISALQEQMEALRRETRASSEEAASQKKRADDLEQELIQRESETASLRAAKTASGSVPVLEGEITELRKARSELQLEIGSLKSQLVAVRTAGEGVHRELADRDSQLGILQRELEGLRLQGSQAEEEIRQLQEHLKVGDFLRQHQS